MQLILSFLQALISSKIGWRKTLVIGGLAIVGLVLYLGVSTGWRFGA